MTEFGSNLITAICKNVICMVVYYCLNFGDLKFGDFYKLGVSYFAISLNFSNFLHIGKLQFY